MVKKIMQFRYYGAKNSKNQPAAIDKTKLVNGNIFTNYLPITRLNILAPAGTKFYLNNSISSIIIGSSGKYELNIEGITKINKITFDSTSINSITESNPLIVDIIYEEENE